MVTIEAFDLPRFGLVVTPDRGGVPAGPGPLGPRGPGSCFWGSNQTTYGESGRAIAKITRPCYRPNPNAL